jgi:hypothetical protein
MEAAAKPATREARDECGDQSESNATVTANARGDVTQSLPPLPRPEVWRSATTTTGRSRKIDLATSWVEVTSSKTCTE